MELNETLVADWIAQEAAANGIIDKIPGGYMFYGDKNDFIVEVKVFKTTRRETLRLKEPDDEGKGYN